MQTRPLPTERAPRLKTDQPRHMTDEHLALLSHEMRTPLSAILNWVQVLQESPTDQDIVSRSAEAIERNARLQAHLVNDLVDISRINVGSMKLKKASCDLDLLLRSTLLAIEPVVRAKRINFNYVASGAVFVHADERRLQQVMTNLIDNAIKFTSVEGTITVALCLRRDSAVVTIADSGCGFAPSLSSRLFEKFHQADRASQRDGLGLGLYIVKNIVELHDGTITAHSTGPGEGAIFTVQLPAAAGDRSSAAAPPLESCADQGAKSKVIRELGPERQCADLRKHPTDDEQVQDGDD